MKFDFTKLLPHIVAVIAFILISSLYFLPQFSGKTIPQSDIQQFKGMSSEVAEYQKKGETILWTNSMFGGMPTFQITAPAQKNVSKWYEKSLGIFFQRPTGYFIAGMLAFYLALILCGVNSWIALIGSIVFAFSTNNMVLYEAGHTSKIRVLMVSILVLAGVIQVFRKKYVVGSLMFLVGMAISLYANHFQMTYYLGIILGIYVVIKGIELVKKGELAHFGKSIALLTAMGIIAIGSSASKIWTTYEYQKSTMRGKPILEQSSDPNSSSAVEGLAWNYAMNWSNGLIDVVAMYIPGVAGGGSSEKISKSADSFRYFNRPGSKSKFAPLYWGKLPFTSGPQYLGAITMLLFFISLFVVKPTLRYWGIVAFLLTIVMSMGNNIEWFNKMLFDNVPLLNKFRSPSSITSITGILVAFIAFMGMNRLLEADYVEKNTKYLKSVVIGVGAVLSLICLNYAFIGPSFFDFSAASDARYAQNPGVVDALVNDRASLMRSDALRTLMFTLLTAGSLYLVLIGKLKKVAAVAIIGVLLLVDLWGVDMRYLDHNSFEKNRRIESSLAPRAVDLQLDKDTDPHFRVHDITSPGEGPYNSTKTSLHNKSLGGYHAAKLQRYNDVIYEYLIRGEPNSLNMLNTKYLIKGTPGAEEVQRNPAAFGNAWFVSNILTANSAKEEFENIKSTDLKSTAIISSEFNLNSASYSNAGTITLTSYHPDKMVYESNNSGAGLAVFSEVWYDGQGWKAYIDGKEANLIRANYLLRAVEIPAGKHTIEMVFKPRAYYTGEIISLICSILIVLLTIGGLYLTFRPSEAEKLKKI